MRCAKLRLQERSKPVTKCEKTVEKPRRYCQKRMVNPDHEEDPRWTDVFERYHCHEDFRLHEILDNAQQHQENDDLYLTVQTLKFQGDVEPIRRPRTSFKYKTMTDNRKHRMFVKQVVQEVFEDADRSSQLTCYYYDDYVKYLFNNDRSRPTSGKSTIFLQGLGNKLNENKAVQVENLNETNKKTKNESKVKTCIKRIPDDDTIDSKNIEDMKDTKVTYRKFGKRKSLTISRAQSPETVQVIRVDVVCNYSSSSVLSDDDNKMNSDSNFDRANKTETINIKTSHFANKYLLTDTIKTLDEKLSGGAKVTLLCKTFKLTDRSKLESKQDKTVPSEKDTKGGLNNTGKKFKCKK